MSMFENGGTPNGASASQSADLTNDVAEGLGETYDWDDSINGDSNVSTPLPEGDYVFTVVSFERGRHQGSDKLPPCNKAIIKLRVGEAQDAVTIQTYLYLCKRMEWALAAFFRCIGQKKRGERIRMDWSSVVGSKGRAHLKPRTYTDGSKTRTLTEVDKFLDYDASLMTDESEDVGEIPFGS